MMHGSDNNDSELLTKETLLFANGPKFNVTVLREKVL